MSVLSEEKVCKFLLDSRKDNTPGNWCFICCSHSLYCIGDRLQISVSPAPEAQSAINPKAGIQLAVETPDSLFAGWVLKCLEKNFSAAILLSDEPR